MRAKKKAAEEAEQENLRRQADQLQYNVSVKERIPSPTDIPETPKHSH